MLCRTSSRIGRYVPRPRFLTLARKAIGLAIFFGGSAVIVLHLLRRVSES
jgi:hypothetical protein